MPGDLTINSSLVVKSSGARTNKSYSAGTTITAGEAVYYVSTSGWLKATSLGTAAQAGSGGLFGIALHNAIASQPLTVITSGPLTIGATLVTGTPYMISFTTGKICDFAYLALAGLVYATYLGYASSTTVLNMSIRKYTGVQLPEV